MEELKFVWFSNATEAVTKNPAVQLPELFVDDMIPEECDGSRFGSALTAFMRL